MSSMLFSKKSIRSIKTRKNMKNGIIFMIYYHKQIAFLLLNEPL